MDLDNLEDEVLLGESHRAAAPPAVIASAGVVDMSYHPTQPILAAGLVTGEVEIFQATTLSSGGTEMTKLALQNDFGEWIFKGAYREDEVVMNYHHQNMLMHPLGGVSAIEFTDDGQYLVSASGDRSVSVMDCVSLKLAIHIPADDMRAVNEKHKKVNTMNKKAAPKGEIIIKNGKKYRRKPREDTKGGQSFLAPVNPHKLGISALNVCDENFISTGDDDGLVAIWDMRQRQVAHTYHEHGDYISQLCYFTDVQELVSSSGDTCLGVYDMRAGKIRDYSEPRKDEISCFAFINSSGTGNTSFIPSIICGTSEGNLPIWKYGSWRRPYDVMERHPREVESIISFHGEDTSFNHNIILTGACDGLVRVMQMYPFRRNLCQLSARDFTYSHANSLGVGGSGHHEHNSSYVVKRKRGDEAISKMRVSHDSSVLAVCGTDNVIDFVDASFLNDEKRLDELRGKAEQRHLRTIRDLDRERDAQEEREKERAARRAEGLPSDSDSDEDSDSDSDGAGTPSSSSSSVSGEKMEELDSDSDSSDDDSDSDDSGDMLAKFNKREDRKKQLRKRSRDSDSDDSVDDSDDSSSDSDASSDGSEDSTKKYGKGGDPARVIAKRKMIPHLPPGIIPKSAEALGIALSDKEKKKLKLQEKKKKAKEAAKEREKAKKKAAKKQAASDAEAPEMDSMEAYRTERQKNRDRAAAGRWLKEEKKKKVNFAFEKRRRRVGGFFGDMQNNND